ncbi:metal-dependent hydrolase family protein [Zeaxanthinibacter enoshimensis]|uniref:Imidazolonepropionase-like amidohydrolase n=1 Tax=Zeaxanthinibacter enoshimensis TaxID=392009 RepID=A0A4R6TMB5_9FLAO|nr:amidohydrolase family protein [Zeaxanthinibacter enoshimensis]TDQ32345.1 imidazolonepropionase-like amidohydrolase [Zeaxanthinibacter enoshimensis]
MKKLIFLLVMLASLTLSAQTTYLQCGAILDTKTGKLFPERTIVVNGNKISEIREGYVGDKASARIIDLRAKTVMPGFIDMHVHIESESNPKAYLQTYTLNEADIAFNSVGFAETTLRAGFTTVRDLGGSGVNIAIRDAIAAGKIKGPRVFTAGKAIGTTGGHADPTNGYREDLVGDPGPKEGVVNSVDDARKAVRQRYKNGADLIKITATGGVLSVAKNGQNPQFTLEEIKAITQTAADYGYHVAAHAHGDEGMQRAVKGGVKTIEHGTLMSEETMRLMKEYDAYLVPTITAGKEVTENARIEGYFPAVIAKKALEIGPKIQDTFKKAYELGVPIAFGTDAGVFPHGENAREFVYMVEAGMPVLKAIQSATLTNARLLGMQDSLGQLSKDFLADIIAVDGNPLENVNLLKEVTFVMKDGEVIKQ